MANFHRHTGEPGMDFYVLMPSAFNNKDEKLATNPTAASSVDTSYIRTSYIVPLPNDQKLALRAV